MFGLSGLSIRIESPLSEAARHLIDRSGQTPSKTSADVDRAEDLHAPNAEFIVARLNGDPVGCIALLDHVRYGEVRRLYVAEKARGNGVAVALVEALEAAARDIGLRQVRIVSDLAGPAADAFARLGFRPGTAGPGGWLEKTL